MRNPFKFVSVMARLIGYYLASGRKTRWILWRYVPLLWKYRKHAAVAIYWLIALKHFRETLVRHGKLGNIQFEDKLDEDAVVEECHTK
jgi:hypothetical protein